MIVITTPASSLQLLTIAQLRAAAGLAVGDASQDAALTALGLRIAAEVSNACSVPYGPSKPATLLKERLTETFRDVWGREQLVLARRFDVSIVSVTTDDTLLNAADYEVEPESGLLYRLSSDCRICWRFRKAVVVYDAGFATVPDDLVGVASDLVRIRTSEAGRDPAVKSERAEVPGVLMEITDFWVGAVPGSVGPGGVPDDIVARLSRYRTIAVG